MLVLTRRLGEVVVIGEDAAITIEVLRINGNQVRLGITAGKDVLIYRQEIYDRIKASKAAEIVDLEAVANEDVA